MGRSIAVVLFTDLVGSTELRSRVGEEAAEELRRTHDRLLRQAVEANSGRVVKGLGDGIMATFAGASDAVAAAVAVQQAIDRLNRSGKAPVPLAVRVGLSAGDVSFEDDDVHGTPVIEAARLCAAADGGEILAADVVRVLAGARQGQDYAVVGPLELKGLATPLPALRVEWEPLSQSTIPLPALLTDVGRIFVGRDGELERLGQLWKEAVAGERRVALLAGEPGVGKTRLAAELAGQVHEEGAVVLAGRCDEDLGVPYQPFVEALRHYVDQTRSEDTAERFGRYGGELVRLVPELAARVRELPPPLASDPETERYRLFDAVGGWLAAMATDQPVLVVLDDLQWAAKPTLLLLRHVTRSPEVKGLLILGTYRDTDIGPDHPLAEVFADMRRQGGVDRVSLLGLDRSGVSAYMEKAAGHTLDDDDLDVARAVYDETEGNPFFVREVFRHLVETGAIERQGGRWTIRLPLDQLGIPESVRDVVGRRLSRLSDEANRVLRVAAVVGPEFDLSIAQMVAGVDENAVLSSVEEATRARLVIESANTANRYRFAHALVRDTLYGELSASRRVSLHRQVAQAIETVHATRLDDHLPALAHHWARASAPAADTIKAVDYATRAGDRALAQLAHDEAAAYYLQALDLLSTGGGDEGQRVELLISLGEAQRRAGDASHRETLREAAQLARRRGDADALARAALANTRGILMSTAGQLGTQRIEMLRDAVEATSTDENTTRAELLATLAFELAISGDRDERVALADEALRIARKTGDPLTIARVLISRFYAVISPDTFDQRLAHSEELVSLAETLHDPATRSRAWFLRARAAMEDGDLAEFDRAFTRYERIVDELAQPTFRWSTGLLRFGRTLLAGDLETAERLARETADIGHLAGQPDADLFLAYHLFTVLLERDRLDEIKGLFVESTRFDPRLAIWKATTARLHCELGQPERAASMLDEFADAGFELPFDPWWWHTCSIWASVCSLLHRPTEAAELHRILAPWAIQVGFPVTGICNAAVAHYLGVLATTLGNWDEAAHHFASAYAIHERIPAPIWLARTRLEWARMLLTRGHTGDAERAQDLLEQALATA
ncbi:MAG: AAA family ATPase, partial [Actinomycetota bacterium]|nr:AAA family ATPase [Actinomycetota bacterium]